MSTQAATAHFGDYVELTKPRLSALSVITALVAYVAARPQQAGWHLLVAVSGIALAAGGVAVLNQYMEVDTDAHMRRTAERPLPSGRVATGSAFVLGWGMCLLSLALLFALVNGLSAFFALLTMVCYLALYTPAKRFFSHATELGAVAGALPPLIGWSAAEGRISALGWILFGVLLFWQIPHFMAIAWLYRKDYATVHFPMLSVRDETGSRVAAWSLVNCLFLVVVSLLPGFLGEATLLYTVPTVLAGAWFLWRSVAFLNPRQRELSARKLFYASLVYLPCQHLFLVVDRVLNHP